MKYGFLRGHKVAECQDSQTQLMERFLKDGVVDTWSDSETAPEKNAAADTDKSADTETQSEIIPDLKVSTTGADGGNADTADTTADTDKSADTTTQSEGNSNEKTKRGSRRN